MKKMLEILKSMLKKSFEIIKSIPQWIKKQYFFHFFAWIYWILSIFAILFPGSTIEDIIFILIIFVPLFTVLAFIYFIPIILIVMLIKYIRHRTVCVTSTFLLHNKVYGFVYWVTIPTVIGLAIFVISTRAFIPVAS